MGLLEKMARRRVEKSTITLGGGQGFTQPPFWADGLNSGMWDFSLTGGKEKIEPDYPSYIDKAFKANPAVFSCIRFRMAVLSEARFQWRPFNRGRPGELFGTAELSLLEKPWPGGTTGDLISRMEVISSMAGNAYMTVADDEGRLGNSARGNRRVVFMRPDWTTIVIDSASGDPNALDAKVVAFLYEPTSLNAARRSEPVTLLPEEVAHFAPIPDPSARFRGMSWLTPAIEEVRSDKAATVHKGRFFDNGAHPNMVVTLSEAVGPEAFQEYVTKFKLAHQGAENAYKTLFLAGGADVTPLSFDFKQMDFRSLQQLSETRIAMAAGIHPTVVGMAEGLQGSSLNAGNFQAAARLTANTTLRPWWRNACASLQTLVTPPSEGTSLWYDDSDISFLFDDANDLATIRQRNAATVRSLVDGGWRPDAAVEYVRSDDMGQLVGEHTGLFSVQLLPGNPDGVTGDANSNANARSGGSGGNNSGRIQGPPTGPGASASAPDAGASPPTV